MNRFLDHNHCERGVKRQRERIRRRRGVESGLYALKREGRYKRESSGAQETMTKEAKKKIKGKKKGWADTSDNLSARFPSSTSASEGGAFSHSDFYSLYAQHQFGQFAAWVSSRARHSRYLRPHLRPLVPPLPIRPSLGLTAFRYRDPTNLSVACPLDDDRPPG